MGKIYWCIIAGLLLVSLIIGLAADIELFRMLT